MELLTAAANSIYYVSLAAAAVAAVAICLVVVGASGFSIKSGDLIFAGAGLAIALVITLLAIAPLYLFAVEYHLTPDSTATFSLDFWIVYLLELLAGIAILLLYNRKARLIPVYLLFMFIALIGSSWVATTIELTMYIWGNGYASSGWKIVIAIAGVVYTLVYFAVPLILFSNVSNLFENQAEKQPTPAH